MGNGRVRKNNLLHIPGLIKIIIYPLPLTPPGNEIEMTLTILADILQGSIGILQTKLVIRRRESTILQYLLHNLRNRPSQKDLVVMHKRKPPKTRD